jgi:hypothetical protein
MTTKELIDKSLGFIGSEGYSGLIATGKTSGQALDTLLSPILGDIALDKQKNTKRNLLRQELIVVSKLDTGTYRVTITPAGAYRISANELHSLNIPVDEPWDGKWRLISYDIPSSKKSERYQFTKHLKRLGCLPLQSSMWVHAYKCEHAITLLADSLGLLRYLSIAEVTQFDKATDSKVRKFFTAI